MKRLCLSVSLAKPWDSLKELSQVTEEGEVWVSVLKLLHPQLDGWMDGWSFLFPELHILQQVTAFLGNAKSLSWMRPNFPYGW